MQNSLESDQARHFAGTDLGSNCFLKLLAEDACRMKSYLKLKLKFNIAVIQLQEMYKRWNLHFVNFLHLAHLLNYCIKLVTYSGLTLQAPITTAADDKFCNIFSNFL